MLDTIQNIFNAFGAIVFVPVILFIVAKGMGVKTKKALDCAILSAVGLEGFTLIINSYSGIIGPVVEQMVETTGVNLEIVDIGWQATSVVAYSTTIGIIFFAIAVILQLALYFLKFTNVFMVSDLWNNYGFMVWGSMLYLLTKNIFLALLLMVIQNLYCMLFSEALAKRFSNYYGYPNCCLSVPMHMDAVPFAIVMNAILNKLGLNKIKASPKALADKAGMLADPKVIGLILGGVIATISYSHSLNSLESWGAIATCAIATSAVMTVFPKVAGIFASAFTPLSSAYAKKAAESGKGRNWYAGWPAHWIQHAVGAMTDSSHGEGLAVINPAWLDFINEENPRKFVQFSRNVLNLERPEGVSDVEYGQMGLDYLRARFKQWGLPSTLRELGVTREMFPALIKNIMNNNEAFVFTEQQIEQVLERCYE